MFASSSVADPSIIVISAKPQLGSSGALPHGLSTWKAIVASFPSPEGPLAPPEEAQPNMTSLELRKMGGGQSTLRPVLPRKPPSIAPRKASLALSNPSRTSKEPMLGRPAPSTSNWTISLGAAVWRAGESAMLPVGVGVLVGPVVLVSVAKVVDGAVGMGVSVAVASGVLVAAGIRVVVGVGVAVPATEEVMRAPMQTPASVRGGSQLRISSTFSSNTVTSRRAKRVTPAAPSL